MTAMSRSSANTRSRYILIPRYACMVGLYPRDAPQILPFFRYLQISSEQLIQGSWRDARSCPRHSRLASTLHLQKWQNANCSQKKVQWRSSQHASTSENFDKYRRLVAIYDHKTRCYQATNVKTTAWFKSQGIRKPQAGMEKTWTFPVNHQIWGQRLLAIPPQCEHTHTLTGTHTHIYICMYIY